MAYNELIIFSKKNELIQGIFGQCLIWLLELLYFLETSNIINEHTKIIFNINTLNNDNLIPNFILPKKLYTLNQFSKPGKISLVQAKKRFGFGFEFNKNSFKKANNIFHKYFKFHDLIINEVYKLNINTKTLGIHYRGTDKNYDSLQANYITQDETLAIIQDYGKNNKIEKIFCCSDEQSFINKIKLLFPNKLIEYKQIRANHSNNYGFFREGHTSPKNIKNNLTLSCIIDMYALSKCNTIIKTSSALSSFSKLINTSLNLYTVSAMKLPWFPAGVAEPYKTNSAIIKSILERTMKGDALQNK
jgi:hypothetical protein